MVIAGSQYFYGENLNFVRSRYSNVKKGKNASPHVTPLVVVDNSDVMRWRHRPCVHIFFAC